MTTDEVNHISFAGQPAAEGIAQAGAGHRAPTARRAGSGSKAITCAGPRASVASGRRWPSSPSRCGLRHAAEWSGAAVKTVVLADALLAGVSGLESPAPMGFVLELPAPPPVAPDAPTVVLDRLQDAGNVGSILRSAAAFGFGQVIALKGTAALWAPKVLRAGMGAHFGLQLIEGVEPEALDALAVPCIATSSHRGDWLHRTQLPSPCAWLMGHEGQGVSRRPGGARGAACAHRPAGRRGVAQRRCSGGDLPARERRCGQGISRRRL